MASSREARLTANNQFHCASVNSSGTSRSRFGAGVSEPTLSSWRYSNACWICTTPDS